MGFCVVLWGAVWCCVLMWGVVGSYGVVWGAVRFCTGDVECCGVIACVL